MPNKTIASLLFIVLLCTGVGHADSKTDAIKKLADLNSVAVQKSDLETIIKYTYPKLIETVGGKDKMVEVMKNVTDGMEKSGIVIVSVTAGEPGPVTTSGDKMYSIVPTLMILNTKDDKVTQESFLLAVSSDKGTTWSFLDGSGIDNFNIVDVIPDFPETLKLPFKQPSKMEPLKSSLPATP